MSKPSRFWNWLSMTGREFMDAMTVAGCAHTGMPIPQELLDRTYGKPADSKAKQAAASAPAPGQSSSSPT